MSVCMLVFPSLLQRRRHPASLACSRVQSEEVSIFARARWECPLCRQNITTVGAVYHDILCNGEPVPEAKGDTLHQLMSNNPSIAQIVQQLLGRFVIGVRPENSSRDRPLPATAHTESETNYDASDVEPVHAANLHEHQLECAVDATPEAASILGGSPSASSANRPRRPIPLPVYASNKLLQILPPLEPIAVPSEQRGRAASRDSGRGEGPGSLDPVLDVLSIEDAGGGGGVPQCRNGWLPGRVHATVL